MEPGFDAAPSSHQWTRLVDPSSGDVSSCALGFGAPASSSAAANNLHGVLSGVVNGCFPTTTTDSCSPATASKVLDCMLSSLFSCDEGAKPVAPCAPPPSLILLLLLHGSVGMASLRRSQILRNLADHKLSVAVAERPASPQKRRHAAVVSRVLHRAGVSSAREEETAAPPTLNPAAAPFVPERLRQRSDMLHVCDSLLPDIASQVTGFRIPTSDAPPAAAPVQRKAARRSQSLSLTQLTSSIWDRGSGAKLCPLQLFHPQAPPAHLRSADKSEHNTDAQDRQSRNLIQHLTTAAADQVLTETLEHLHGASLQHSTSYGCRIVPIYEEKQTRYRALRHQEESRWQDTKSECLSIQQLAIASLSRPIPASLNDRSAADFLHMRTEETGPHVSRLCRPPEARRSSNSVTSRDTHESSLGCLGRQLPSSKLMSGLYIGPGKVPSTPEFVTDEYGFNHAEEIPPPHNPLLHVDTQSYKLNPC